MLIGFETAVCRSAEITNNPHFVIENEEDVKRIEESFKRMDEHTKDFQALVAIHHPLGVLMQFFAARSCVEN